MPGANLAAEVGLVIVVGLAQTHLRLAAADLRNHIAALKALLLESERRVQEPDDQVAGLKAQLNGHHATSRHANRCLSTCLAMKRSTCPPADACQFCGGGLRLLREYVAELLEYVPPASG